MAIEGLDFMLRDGHLFYEVSESLGPLERLSIPHQGRAWTIELREVVEASVGIISSVVDSGEVISSACCNFNTGRRERVEKRAKTTEMRQTRWE